MQHQRWPAIVIAGLLILAAMSPWLIPGGRTLAQSQTSFDLTTAVRLAGSATPGLPDASLIVQTVAEQGDWAYGTAATPAAGDHGTPGTRFFLGQLTGDGWTIAFRYTDAFTSLLAAAPPSFPTPAIRATLDGFTIAGDGSSQLSFPFAVGTTWRFTGPHPPMGADVWDALDFFPFNPGQSLDVPVLSMRGGIAYRPCDDMVIIDHGDGWQTGYYHLINIAVEHGQTVTRGQHIGGTGDVWNCGGNSDGNHVHVWISYLGQPTPIAGHDIGGWTVEAGQYSYQGCLVRGEVRRCTYDQNPYIVNDGEIGSSSGSPLASVDINAGAVGDQISYVIDGYPANQEVTVSWRRPGGSVVSLGSVTTNASGDATGSFIVPATTGGPENIVRFIAGDLARTIKFRVAQSIRLSPAVAGPGDQLRVTLTGYSKQATAAISYTPDRSFERFPLANVATNNTGGASTTITLPSDIPLGPTVIEAIVGLENENFARAELFVGTGPTLDITTRLLQPGQPFSYEAYLLPANSAVTLAITSETGGEPLASLPAVTTDASGRITASATVPVLPRGSYQLRAMIEGSEIASTAYAIDPILVTPATPLERGATTDITGHGFTAESPISLSWRTGAEPVLLGTGSTDRNGSFTLSITVPPSPDTTITLHAADGASVEALAGLKVQGGPVAGPPSVTVTPVRSTVNTMLSYSLVNFPPNSRVDIEWKRTTGSTIVIGAVTTNSVGSATGQVRVPATPGGAGQVIRFTSDDAVATATFEVVPRIKVTPSPAARGTTVDVSLRGYGKKEAVRIRWKQGNSWVEVARVTASNTGSANVRITVPDWAPDGANSVRGDGTLFRAQTNVVQISGGEFAPASASETATPSPTASPDDSPSATATATSPATGTPEPTATATATEPVEPSPTETMTPAPTETATAAPPEEPTATGTVTETPPDEPGSESSQ